MSLLIAELMLIGRRCEEDLEKGETGAAAQKATLTGPQARVTDSGEPAHSDDAAPAADAIDDPLNPRRLA